MGRRGTHGAANHSDRQPGPAPRAVASRRAICHRMRACESLVPSCGCAAACSSCNPFRPSSLARSLSLMCLCTHSICANPFVFAPAGHTFQLLLINIPTACEICQLFLMWPIERGLVSVDWGLSIFKKKTIILIFCIFISLSVNFPQFIEYFIIYPLGEPIQIYIYLLSSVSKIQ